MNRRDFFVQSVALGAGFSCVGMSAAQENASSTANSFTSPQLKRRHALDLRSRIYNDRLHAACFNGLLTAFGANDRGAFCAEFSVEKNLLPGHEGCLGRLGCVVVDGDVGVGSDGEMPFVFETQHAGRIQGRFLHEFRQTQHVEFHERQPLRQNHIARDAAAVRGDCVNNERSVVSFGMCERNARKRRIDIEAAADVAVGIFPELESFLSGDQIRIAARVVNNKGFLGQQGRAYAVSIFRESEVTQTVARDFRLNLAVWAACQTSAILGRDVAFAEDVRVLLSRSMAMPASSISLLMAPRQ